MRRRRHPFTEAVRRSLSPRLEPTARRFLDLLDRRLSTLAEGRSIRFRPAERALARQFLGPLEGAWDDGDENLVRGHLDRWLAPGEDVARAARRSLLRTARTLSGMRVRPATLWFFLWEMESVLAGLAAGETGSADKPGRAC